MQWSCSLVVGTLALISGFLFLTGSYETLWKLGARNISKCRRVLLVRKHIYALPTSLLFFLLILSFLKRVTAFKEPVGRKLL
jgi:hypothetical protein